MILCILCLKISAQELPSGEIEDVQVIIEKDRPLTLPMVKRSYQKSDIRSLPKDTSSIDYRFSKKNFKVSPYQIGHEAQPYATSTPETLDQNFVKVGFGNYGSPIVEGYYSQSERSNFLGAYVLHESFAKGPVRGKESGFSKNKLSLNGEYITRYQVFKPILNYERDGFYYYGYDQQAYNQTNEVITDRFIQTRSIFSTFSLGAVVASRQSGEAWSYQFAPIFNRVSMKFKGEDSFNTETSFDLGGFARYDLGDGSGVKAGLSFFRANYNGNADEQVRDRLSFNPSYFASRDQFSFSAGVELVYATNPAAKVYLYPDVAVAYAFGSSKIALVVDGGLEMNTLESVYQKGRYLDDSLTLSTTNRMFAMSGAFNTQVQDNLWLSIGVGYDLSKNQPLFKRSAYDSSRYELIYDGHLNTLELNIRGVYEPVKTLNVGLGFHIFQYDLDSQPEAWYLPSGTLSLDVAYKPSDDLRLQIAYVMLAGIKEPVFDDTRGIQSAENLPLIHDLNISARYLINDNIRAYAEIFNVLAQEYERFTNYPVRSVAFKLGFILHF